MDVTPLILIQTVLCGAIGHLHDYAILLPRPESFKVLFSHANWVFCYFNLAGISKFKYERKMKKIVVVVEKQCHHANGLFPR